MMVVLQTFAEREYRDRVIVGTVIVRIEPAGSEIMTDRSDAPARLVDDEAADQSAPQET